MKTLLITFALLVSFVSNAQKIQFQVSGNSVQKDHTQWISVVHSGFYGFVDADGKEVVPTVYDVIAPFGDFKKDWALVNKDGLYGFINTEGKVVVEPIYLKIEKFGIYKEDWALVVRDDLYGFINTEGKEIVVAKYEEVPLKAK